MEPVYRLPPAAAAEVAAQAAGDHEPTVPRDAASVILVRDGIVAGVDGEDGTAAPEFYLLKRHRGMAFAGGMAVFPGGSVDALDGSREIAAMRELFEETGVLLADVPAADLADADAWEEDRRSLEAHEVSFAEVLERRRLDLRADLLTPWAIWVTPDFEPRRYATYFFIARLPAGQDALGVSTEAQSVSWTTARDALAAADAGELLMLPPQFSILTQLSRYASVDEILAATPDLTPVRPTVAEDTDGPYLVLPEHLLRTLRGT